MSDPVTDALKEQFHQTHRQLSTLSEAVTAMANSISDLTTQLARVEERHAAQDELVRRIGRETNDHEQRIRGLERAVDPEKVADNERAIKDLDTRTRQLENTKQQAAGGWRTIAIIASTFAAAATIGVGVYAAIP